MFIAGEILSNYMANQMAVTSSTALVTAAPLEYTSVALASGGVGIRVRFTVPFTLAGATSGYKFRVVSPGNSIYSLSAQVFEAGGSLVQSVFQNSAADISNAAAAGTYTLFIDAFIKTNSGATTSLQFAQLVADPAAITVLQAARMEVVLAG